MPKHCEHWYWDVNPQYRYRRCKYCYLMQYNYTGKWVDEMGLGQFMSHWTPLDGHEHIPRITLTGCQLFEFQCYESWGVAFKVQIEDDEPLGPFHNLNQAHNALVKKYGEHKGWETFQKKDYIEINKTETTEDLRF